MLTTIIYIVTTVFTYVMGKISKALKWNEELPIQVQNLVIGVISFVVFYLIEKPVDIEATLQQIITALGGVSTAALIYDTTRIKEDK